MTVQRGRAIIAPGGKQMRIAREEVFGPVLSILGFDDEAQVAAVPFRTAYHASSLHQSREHQAATFGRNSRRSVSSPSSSANSVPISRSGRSTVTLVSPPVCQSV